MVADRYSLFGWLSSSGFAFGFGLLFCLGGSVASGQIVIETEPARAIADGDGSYILIPPKSPGTIVKSTLVIPQGIEASEGWQVRVTARGRDGKLVPVIETEPMRYLVLTDRYAIFQFRAINFGLQLWHEEDVAINEDVEPEPDPDEPDNPDDPDVPPPDVPSDPFDNLGQRVAVWSKDAPKRHDVGMIYVDVSKRLSDGQIVSINDAAAEIVSRADTMLGVAGKEAWKKTSQEIQSDLDSRWPMARKTYSEWLLAIAAGLGVQP